MTLQLLLWMLLWVRMYICIYTYFCRDRFKCKDLGSLLLNLSRIYKVWAFFGDWKIFWDKIWVLFSQLSVILAWRDKYFKKICRVNLLATQRSRTTILSPNSSFFHSYTKEILTNSTPRSQSCYDFFVESLLTLLYLCS